MVPRGRDLPPPTRQALARIFDPALKELGLRTARAGLQDPDKSYRFTKDGTHLAVYVEPTSKGEVEGAVFLENVVASAQVYLPTVFRRWPGLETFDVCLEPEAIFAPTPFPPPVTQLQVSKEAAAEVRWKRLTLARLLELVAASGDGETGDRESLFLYLSPRLRDEPAYLDAREAAGLPPVTTEPTEPTEPTGAYG